MAQCDDPAGLTSADGVRRGDLVALADRPGEFLVVGVYVRDGARVLAACRWHPTRPGRTLRLTDRPGLARLIHRSGQDA